MTIMNAVAGAILVAFGLFLMGLAVVVFAKPATAERFFLSFASSARAHYTEQVVRLLIGASLIIRSAANVATEGLLVCRMGHRLVLLAVDPHSLAMAPSFRRGSASDAHSAHETVCGRAIGVRSFTHLGGVYCDFPMCGITSRSRRTRPNDSIQGNPRGIFPISVGRWLL